MRGDARPLINFLGKNDRFEIPIYQRNYSWKTEQCAQLFRDLESTIRNNKSAHFFGSLVSVAEKDNLLIIDGQQRITTVSLLILALKELIDNGSKAIDNPQKESAVLYKKYLVDEYSDDTCKLKLRHIPGDAETFEALFEKDFSNKQSKLVKNYLFFQEQIMNSTLSAEEIIDAIERLLIIDISIDKEDNPQLIFESINSTGVDLNEGDKVRNYVLMDLSLGPQTKFYENYWKKVENFTARPNDQDGVGLFIRDFLTAKTSTIPNLSCIYAEFKKYCSNNEALLEDREGVFKLLTAYAEVYHYLLAPESMENADIACGITYLNRQEVTPSYPYLLEILLAWKNNDLTTEQVVTILEVLDSFVFRRQICDLPSNALNKIFADLHKTVMRLDNAAPYEERLKRVLLDKTGKARFPLDGEFRQAIKEKNVYEMRSKNRKYIFARMENGLTKDAKIFGSKDVVYQMIENGHYTIEHIMPQTLNSLWKRDLGDEYSVVHDTWLHRLANLTLTAYNSKLSNKSFNSKVARTTFAELIDSDFGFDESSKHLWLNEFPAQKDHWTAIEMEERANLLADRALQIWKQIETSFVKKINSQNLSIVDTPAEYFTGTKPLEFTIEDETYPVKQWIDLYVQAVAYLYKKDPEKIDIYAKSKNAKGIDGYFRTTPDSKFKQVADNIYLFSHTSTWDKLRILKILIGIYGIEDIQVSISGEATIDFSAKFEAFLNESISSDTVKGYMQALKTLERMMQESNVITDSIFEYTTWEQIKPLKEYLESDLIFIQKNTSAHNKYSAVFNKYAEFISALNEEE